MSVTVARSISWCGSTGTVDPVIGILPGAACQTVTATNTSVVDQIPVNAWSGVSWQVTITSLHGTNTKAFNILATHRFGSNPTFIQYATQGTISCNPSVDVSGGNLRLLITNNGALDVIVRVTRVPVPINAATLSVPVGGFVDIIPQTSIVQGMTTGIVDSFSPFHNYHVKWIITIHNPLLDTYQMVEANATYRIDTPDYLVFYGGLGDSLVDLVLETTLEGTVNLKLTNNTASSVIVDVTRIPVVGCDITNTADTQAGITITPTNTTVATLASVPVSSVNVADVRAAKWVVVIKNVIANTVQIYLVHAQHTGGVSVSHVRYGTTGDIIPHVADVVLAGNLMTLNVTNNSLDSITVDAIEIPIMA